MVLRSVHESHLQVTKCGVLCCSPTNNISIQDLPNDTLSHILQLVARVYDDTNKDRRIPGQLLCVCTRFHRLLLAHATRVVVQCGRSPTFVHLHTQIPQQLPPLHLCVPFPFENRLFDGCAECLSRVTQLSICQECCDSVRSDLSLMTQLRVVEYMTARRRPILRSESDIAYRLYTCNGRRVCVAAAPVDQLSASRTRFPRNGLKPYSNDLAKQLSNVELAMFSNLHTLNLANHDGFEHASLEFVSCITALQYLTLDKCRPPEWTPVFKSISQLSRLCSLSLRGCGFLESDLVHLQNLVSLQALDLNACRGVTNKGLQNVVNLTRLLSLNLSCTSVTDLKPVRGLHEFVKNEGDAVAVQV